MTTGVLEIRTKLHKLSQPTVAKFKVGYTIGNQNWLRPTLVNAVPEETFGKRVKDVMGDKVL